jgi:glycosyltransferase involved in cell wall biosynthesis
MSAQRRTGWVDARGSAPEPSGDPAVRPRLFVVPPPEQAQSGGGLYNEGLLAALRADGIGCLRADPDDPALPALARGSCALWVDSLYLDQLPALRARLGDAPPLGLLAHSLPCFTRGSLDARGAAREQNTDAWPVCISRTERTALRGLAAAIAPSDTMAGLLRQLSPELPLAVVEPPIRRSEAPRVRRAHPIVLLAANLTPNKGVLPFLERLSRALASPRAPGGEGAAFALWIAGRADGDPGYAAACAACVERGPLAGSVRFLGWLSHAALLERMREAEIFVSASRVESFGMALADACASGMLVLARRGGHVERLVGAERGGILADDDAALVDCLLALLRDPAARTERLALAERAAPAPRSFEDVARDFARAEVALLGPHSRLCS